MKACTEGCGGVMHEHESPALSAHAIKDNLHSIQY